MKIAVACDHGGLNLKNAMIAYVQKLGHEVEDFGTTTFDSCDYPDFAVAAAEAVASGRCQRGIVVCSSGIGVSIVANKVPGIRCAHCHDLYCAKYTRLHNDANMIAFGEKVVGVGMMEELVNTFLTTEFEGGERHERRLAKIKAIEEKYYVDVISRKRVEYQRTNPDKFERVLEVEEFVEENERVGFSKEFIYEMIEERYQLKKSTAEKYVRIAQYIKTDKNEADEIVYYTDFAKYFPNDPDFGVSALIAMVEGTKGDKDLMNYLCRERKIHPEMTDKEIKAICKNWHKKP